MNKEEILDLEPLLLWKYFNELSKIPHCSEHEEQVAKYIGTNREAISYIETGARPITTLVLGNLANSLSISLSITLSL